MPGRSSAAYYSSNQSLSRGIHNSCGLQACADLSNSEKGTLCRRMTSPAIVQYPVCTSSLKFWNGSFIAVSCLISTPSPLFLLFNLHTENFIQLKRHFSRFTATFYLPLTSNRCLLLSSWTFLLLSTLLIIKFS